MAVALRSPSFTTRGFRFFIISKLNRELEFPRFTFDFDYILISNYILRPLFPLMKSVTIIARKQI